ncbi:MAG: RIP metalloprotease RseP [bacterium]
MELVELLRIFQVVFGIGLVIFVHEAGHFIAARLCGVRADVFSLGFGPRMFGFHHGGTLYQVAWLPLGGYVKMAGEFPDPSRTPAPDELQAKSVGQRFFIYSGGVIMNVIFALVVFPLVLAAGVPVLRPVVAAPTPGMPAWHAGIPAGTEILAVDGEEVYDFFHIPNEVALADAGPIQLTVRYPGSEALNTLPITPVYSANGGFKQIGVRPGVDPEHLVQVLPGGPAAEAGLMDGDTLLSISGAPAGFTPVRQMKWATLRGEAITVLVRRHGEEKEIPIVPRSTPAERRLFGIEPMQNLIKDLRPGAWVERMGLEKGARLVEVNGQPIRRPGDLGTALRSPGEAQGLTVVLQPSDPNLAPKRVAYGTHPTSAEVVGIESDVYLDYDPDSTLAHASPGRAAQSSGLESGDRLLTVNDVNVQSWGDVLAITRERAERNEATEFTVERLGANTEPVTQVITVTPQPLIQLDFGFGLERASGIYRTGGVAESIRAGAMASWRFLTDAWMTLQKMFLREVSTENLGGIIAISTVSYDWASQGWAKLFFFLCMLSINLAFLNVLPIPVLDGGHLAFCIVEAIKGSPVSERTLGYSQVVGLVLILTLTIYVTYQDVLRLLPTGP